MFINPNKLWIRGLRPTDLSWDELIVSIEALLFYSSLEILSFYHLYSKVNKILKINILHQLAFVLKKHRLIAWAFLTTWIIVIMGFQRDHNGADFTFQFAWIHPPAAAAVDLNDTAVALNETMTNVTLT